MDYISGEEHVESVKKQLLLNIFEILAEQDLLSDEEKIRMKNMINDNGKIQ